MKLRSAKVSNFGSFKELEFDFSNQGLALIYGPTGSGKSTLLDIPCWIIYGITAKGGTVDEIRSWTANNEVTTGRLFVDDIVIHRIRGKQNENDLYWIEQDGTHKRGKDMSETQKFIESRLGVSRDLYIISSYFSEFTPSGSFFAAKAKDRRELFENISCLSFPIMMAEKISEARKSAKKELGSIANQESRINGRLEQLNLQIKSLEGNKCEWYRKQEQYIQSFQSKHDNFETAKASKIAKLEECVKAAEVYRQNKLRELNQDVKDLEVRIQPDGNTTCPTCGVVKQNMNNEIKARIVRLMKETVQVQRTDNPYVTQLEQARKAINEYESLIKLEKYKDNPFLSQIDATFCDIQRAEKELDTLKTQHVELEDLILGLTQLHEMSFELRGRLLAQSVQEIQDSTNRYLQSYFDSEIIVNFTLDSDELDIKIQKNGYFCSFTQLSKGQRALLKLCFSVSVMLIAANKAGIHFSNLFFDEALDGIDSNLKIKAFSLFEELSLSHDSIMLIDHAPEFQNLFIKRYSLCNESDISIIIEDEESENKS